MHVHLTIILTLQGQCKGSTLSMIQCTVHNSVKLPYPQKFTRLLPLVGVVSPQPPQGKLTTTKVLKYYSTSGECNIWMEQMCGCIDLTTITRH